MEVSGSCKLGVDDETKALKQLLDIFGSAIDLREIAAAFCKSGRNFELAAEILSESNGCSSSATHTSNGKSEIVDLSRQQSDNISKTRADVHTKLLKPKKYSVSAGTISSVIGKGYSKPATLSNGSSQTTKPVKVSLNEFSITEIQKEDTSINSSTRKDPINNNIEEFLFNMLGEGFQLGMDVIHDVLGSCGYDPDKSIDKLIDLSASKLNISDDIVGGTAAKSAAKDSKQKDHLLQDKPQEPNCSERNEANLPKEVLTSLFSSDRHEEPPRKTLLVRAVKKTRSFGTVVSEPLIDRTPTLVTDVVDIPKDIKDDDEEEDNYQFLRRVAKEHRVTMKEYYKAAVDAFGKGDRTLAEDLIQKGHFYNKKAQEADERSSQKIFECRNSSKKESSDEIPLDLRDHDVKAAMSLLKLHLGKLGGIASFQNLKVIVENDGEGINKRSKRKRVVSLLEREKIKWTEEGGAIIIQLAEIDPDELSFNKKEEYAV